MGEREGKRGVGLGKTSDGEKGKNHREAELIRCCDGFVSLSLIHSPHLFLFVSLSVSGLPRSAAKNKTIIRLHLNLSSVEFCSCVTLDDKGVESKCPSHYVFFFFYIICFCPYGCLCGNMAFLLPSNATSRALHFFILF